MATSDRNDGVRVVLRVDPLHQPFLSVYLSGVRSGLLADLATFPEQLSDPARDRAIVCLLASLLSDLRRNRLVGTSADLGPLLVEHSAAIDEHNEYERVKAEH